MYFYMLLNIHRKHWYVYVKKHFLENLNTIFEFLKIPSSKMLRSADLLCYHLKKANGANAYEISGPYK
jgi:hypothetical protein